MANRLSGARSIYLRQHADNPVDWWPWSAAVFIEARRRGVPVLLSIGYASCHWCHVMAAESFSDPDTALQMNRSFVCVKVDREERPDVDATYMAAAQALTGSGGWPLTVFLTPDGEPFYAGTYFPPAPMAGLPSLRQVLAAVSRSWADDRSGATATAAHVADLLRSVGGNESMTPPRGEHLDAARDGLLATVDATHGGFGAAPKFPSAMPLEFLLRNHERTGDAAALDAVTLTVERMARGGVYDQVGGGFFRYSTDERWAVPHFEKMLTDNAQLLRLYSRHHRLTGSALSARIVHELADFLTDGLRAGDGLLAASLDADAAGVEGGSYRWRPSELRAALGGADAAVAARIFGVTDRGDDAPAVLRAAAEPPDPETFASIRSRLLAARRRRVQPGRDDIVVLSANALAATALAEAGAATGRKAWVDAAGTIVDSLIRLHRVGRNWLHSSLHGRVGDLPATLAGHAGVVTALAALYQASGQTGRLVLAVRTAHDLIAAYRADDGTWTDMPARRPDAATDGPVLARTVDPTDGAVPSGPSAAAEALLTVGALTGAGAFRIAAEELLAHFAVSALRSPAAAGWYLAVAEAAVAGPLQVAVVGPDDARRDAFAAAARRALPGGAVVDIGGPDEPGRPLLAGWPAVAGAPAAYVCRGFVCDAPVTDPADIAGALRAS